MKYFKLYVTFENCDYNHYVGAMIIGADKIQVLAENSIGAAIYEEDKANAYKRMIENEVDYKGNKPTVILEEVIRK